MKEDKEEKKEQEEKEKSVEEKKKNSKKEDLSAKVEALSKEIEELKDQMLRRQAETENFKKRLIREKEDAVQFANASLIKDLLEFLDNLERTIDVAKKDANAKAIADGIEIIQSQLLSTLSKNWGLEKIESTGKEFDPQLHEACMMETDSSLEKETVLLELQSGYKLHDRVIRPAKVKVGKPE